MKRRWFAVIGASIVLAQGILMAIFGFPAIDGLAVFGLVLPTIAGVLFIAGGFSVQIRNVEWYQFVGTADVLMGIWFGLEFAFGPYTDSTAGPILAVTGIVGGLSMVFIGVNWMRYSRQFGVSRYEPGPIVGFGDRKRT